MSYEVTGFIARDDGEKNEINVRRLVAALDEEKLN